MKVVVAGANGFIGQGLCQALVGRGADVTALVRNVEKAKQHLPANVKALGWSIGRSGPWEAAVQECDAVINLAGASIAGHRWTSEYKIELRESRIQTTQGLVDALRTNKNDGRVLINASAVGYYGDAQDETVTEATPAATDFLGELCSAWEAEALKATPLGVRVVLTRIGIVLGDGGALEKMLPPFRLGVGGPIGSGRQWMPWIHRDDLISLFLWAMETPAIHGPVNATSPNPVRMKEFASILGRVLGRPAFLPTPGFVLRLLFGEFAESLLGGQKTLPKVSLSNGFQWRYPDLEAALHNILHRN